MPHKIALPRLGQAIEPDKQRICEINEALEDKTGIMARKLIVKYEEDKEYRKMLRQILL